MDFDGWWKDKLRGEKVMMAFHHNVKRVREVSQVRKVYVEGSPELVIEIRRRLAKVDSAYGQDACFQVSWRAQADAVLNVSGYSSMTGVDALLGQSGMQVSAELSTKNADPRDYTEHGEPGLTSDGAGAGAQKVLQDLFLESGCTKKGERQ